MDSVDEELRSTGGWLTSVGHGESARLVRESWATWFSELIRDGTITGTGDSLGGAILCNIGVGSATLWSTGTGSARGWVAGVWATELVHEVWNDTVEVETVVEATVGKIDEVAYYVRESQRKNNRQLKILTSGERHLVAVKFDLELAHSGIKDSAWIWHFEDGFLMERLREEIQSAESMLQSESKGFSNENNGPKSVL